VAQFVQEDEVTEAVERVLKTFETLGQKGERIANTIARVGVKVFREEMDWREGD